MAIRVCDVFLIEVAVLVNCWIFSTWLVVNVVKNSHLCSNCLVICSEATSSLSVTVVTMSSAKVLWNSPIIKKATALMTLVMCSGILASNYVEISRFVRVVVS